MLSYLATSAHFHFRLVHVVPLVGLPGPGLRQDLLQGRGGPAGEEEQGEDL